MAKMQQPTDPDIRAVFQKLAQIYQALNEATQELKRLQAKREKEAHHGNR